MQRVSGAPESSRACGLVGAAPSRAVALTRRKQPGSWRRRRAPSTVAARNGGSHSSSSSSSDGGGSSAMPGSPRISSAKGTLRARISVHGRRPGAATARRPTRRRPSPTSTERNPGKGGGRGGGGAARRRSGSSAFDTCVRRAAGSPACATRPPGARRWTRARGYSPALGGAFLANRRGARQGVLEGRPTHASFLGIFAGAGATGADCTPGTTPSTASPGARAALVRIRRGPAALNLDAQSHPTATWRGAAPTSTCASDPVDCAAGEWCDVGPVVPQAPWGKV